MAPAPLHLLKEWSGTLIREAGLARDIHRTLTRRGLLAGSLGTVLATAAVAIPINTADHIYPGTRVHGIDVSGMSPAAADGLLRSRFAAFEQRAATFVLEGATWDATLADLGYTIDYAAMVDAAMAHGRDGDFVDRYVPLVTGGGEREIPLALIRTGDGVTPFLETIAAQVAITPRNATLEVQEGEVVLTEHVTGRALDVAAAATAVETALEAGASARVGLKTVPVEPATTTARLKGAQEAALRIVSEPIALTLDDLIYPIDTDTLAAALVIEEGAEPRLDHDVLAARLDAIAAAVAVAPRNALLGWDGGLFVVQEDQPGRELDRDATIAAIDALAAKDSRRAPLPVREIPAGARADNLDELGIVGHLAGGSSSFAGSSTARAENVAASARNISYKLVPPGGEFSFNELLGPITLENGFVEGTIIDGDFAATDIGGGVCQVSTTVFRAAARAGFQFTEWHPHTWRLAFYEADGSPPGFDGAIYQSDWYELDLRFTNPLDSWLLLQVVIDGATVSAHFYGQPNGWVTEFGEPRLSEPKPIPELKERVNPDLAPGDRRMVQQAAAGVTVSLRRTVTASDGTVISDGDFVSDYESVPEVWEVGPR